MSREIRRGKILARYVLALSATCFAYLSFHLHEKLQPIF